MNPLKRLKLLESKVEELQRDVHNNRKVIVRILDVMLEVFGKKIYSRTKPMTKSVREYLERG